MLLAPPGVSAWPSHCTLAVTAAVALSVNAHVLRLLPPLEHAPDQIASRPFETLSVITVPLTNDADPLLPTATLMPAGLEVTLSPLRPVAVTVSVTVCPGGVTVSVVVRVTPPALAVRVTGVDAATGLVVTAKVALVAPCATVTLAGTVAAPLLLASVTANPPGGAAAVKVTVPCEAAPPVTLVGLTATAESVAGAEGGVTVRVADRVAPPWEPLIVAALDADTDAVVTGKIALVLPLATVTLAGTVAAAVLLLVRVTTAPPVGAALVSVAVPCDAFPPTTVEGLSAIAESAGADAAACGVKRRTEDHAPAVPAELMPRTRHQCCRAASVGAVNCDAVSVRSTTSGVEKLFESSIWMRYDVAALTSVQSNMTGCAGVAACAGLTSIGAEGVGGGATPVELINTFKPGKAPDWPSTMSALLSPLRSAETMA